MRLRQDSHIVGVGPFGFSFLDTCGLDNTNPLNNAQLAGYGPNVVGREMEISVRRKKRKREREREKKDFFFFF